MAKPNDQHELIQIAVSARQQAYAPYSNYRVGAAVRGKSGRIYSGCNVENASYGLTVCAERNAVFKAISEGEREFDAVAVSTINGGSPCGACRQVLYEFMPPETAVMLTDAAGNVVRMTSLAELLPDGFTPQKLEEGQRAALASSRRSTGQSSSARSLKRTRANYNRKST